MTKALKPLSQKRADQKLAKELKRERKNAGRVVKQKLTQEQKDNIKKYGSAPWND